MAAPILQAALKEITSGTNVRAAYVVADLSLPGEAERLVVETALDGDLDGLSVAELFDSLLLSHEDLLSAAEQGRDHGTEQGN